MIPATTFAGKRVAVFGIGLSGVSAGRSLLAGGASVIAWDDNEAGRNAALAAGIVVNDLRKEDWSRFDALVLAPGVPLTHPHPHWTVELAKAHGVEIIADTEIFVRERRASGKTCKVIAVTGTNGKSTTTALTHHLLKTSGADAVLGGNIGTAVLDLDPFADGRIYVLELSSFQLDLTPTLDADMAALLNITPDHLDRHGTLENYASVKGQIFRSLRSGGTAVIGADDPYCDAIADGLASRDDICLLRISATQKILNGVSSINGDLEYVEEGILKDVADVRRVDSLRGAHNWENAAAAMALVGYNFGYDWYTAAAALKTFPGLPHRMEEVGKIGRVLFINDSKATNADAAARALASFENIYWIAGGKPKEGGIESLRQFFPKIKKAYLIGEAAEAFAVTLTGQTAVSPSNSLENAVHEAARDARHDGAPQSVILLSPACASYDQFKNFEARGDAFRGFVQVISSGRPAREKAA